jgi:hypothetical protein
MIFESLILHYVNPIMADTTFDLRGGVVIDTPVVAKKVKEPQKIIDDLTLMAAKGGGVEYTAFSRDDYYTLGDGNPRLPYFRRRDDNKTAVKWGQFKLFTTEIQFLTLYWNPVQVPNPICIYIGAALGTHTATLAKMFPKFQFHLYDNRAFDPILKQVPNVTLHNNYFTDADVEEWSKVRNQVYLISDIRTSTYKMVDNDPGDVIAKENEAKVWDDMLLQQSWVEKIRPVHAHLKFRLPYTFKWITDVSKTREYLDGLIYIQPWAGQSSSECRLVPYPDLHKRDWNLSAYEDMIFYHNAITRELTRFLNPLSGNGEAVATELGLSDDYDSVCFSQIVIDYLKKSKVIATPENFKAVANSIINGANSGRTNLLGLRSGIKVAIPGDDDDDD